ncbi:MAG: rod shape-determining protein MreC [Rhodoferax sp.]
MPLETLERTPPPFFRQGPSARTKLVLLSLLAVLLMVADQRFKVAQPLRAVVATVIYPLQWLVLQPIERWASASAYFESLSEAREREARAQYRLGLQSQRAQQVEQLSLENARLRALLDLQPRLDPPALAAQVLYDMTDPYSSKVVIDRGQIAAVQAGAAVLDDQGVLGQVTRVYPLLSEVTLITDANQSTPVLNARTGVRGVVFGGGRDAPLELRFMDAHVDIQEGDLLTTSGVDGVYPPGFAVARVTRVERRGDTAFARIVCQPQARVHGSGHVLVLRMAQDAMPSRPEPPAPSGGRTGGRR